MSSDADHTGVMIESGRWKIVAVALGWPGWERSAGSEGSALATLESYRARYGVFARIAGLSGAFEAAGPLEAVERLGGSSTTDHFGISTRSASAEAGAMTEDECQKRIALLRAAWARFDEVASSVSA